MIRPTALGRALLGLLLATTALLGTARADLASSLASGRLALVNQDLPAALNHFQAAVTAAPNDAEANVLLGLARTASLVNRPEGASILTKLGVTKTGRNVLDWGARFPARFTASKLTSDEVEATALTTIVPEFAATIQNFSAATDPGFLLALSADETHAVAFTMDRGDVLFLKSLLQGITCGIHLIDTQESNLSVGEIDRLLFSNGLTIERLLTTKPTLFTAETSAGAAATAASGAYTAAVNTYVEAVTFIRARLDNTGRLIALDPSQDAGEAQHRAYLEKVRDSLANQIAFDTRTQLAASAFVAMPKGVRTLLPTPYKNNGPTLAATIPDAGFGGVLPGLTAERALDWFRSIKRDTDKAFRFRDDPIAPTITLLTPRGRALYGGTDTVVVRGTASDNLGVQRVVVERAGGARFEATITGSDPKKVEWQATVPATPGTNVVRAIAYDGQPNPSKAVSSTFDFVKNNSITIEVQGEGSVSRKSGDFKIGKIAKLVAKPAKDWIFREWQFDGFPISFKAKLSFNPPNITSGTLTAVFIPNPFPAFAGAYQGLLTTETFDPDTGDFIEVVRGNYTVTLGSKGSLTVNGTLFGKPFKAKGSLDGYGRLQLQIARRGLEPLEIYITLDLDLGGITFDVFDPENFAGFFGFADIYRDAATLPDKFTATFTPDDAESSFLPGGLLGSGYATLTRGKSGAYRIVGSLPDGTKLSCSAHPLYDGNFGTPALTVFQLGVNGSSQLDGQLFIQESDFTIGGPLHFSSLDGTAGIPQSFDVSLLVQGAPYLAPLRGERIAPLGPAGSGDITITAEDPNNPGLTSNIAVATFTVSTANVVAVEPGAGITLKLTAASGLFTGSYLDPDTGAKRTFGGVILQPIFTNSGLGLGYGLRPGQSDAVTLNLTSD